ncbi:hypothetical protein BC939DRAFT_444798, partial [Gamsiella multidivaricata]|uniref:uncharacterized protein n=1 Tax=Gamsiella multidivaricata TaxID=101098 RepID=UPI00221F3AA9
MTGLVATCLVLGIASLFFFFVVCLVCSFLSKFYMPFNFNGPLRYAAFVCSSWYALSLQEYCYIVHIKVVVV